MALPVDRKDLTRAVKAAAASDDPLDRLVAALALQSELDALGAEVVQRFVGKAREAGCSWARIGEALGVTKQAVQQRFTERPGDRTGTARQTGARPAGARSGARAEGAGPSALAAALDRAAAEARRSGRRQVEPAHVSAALLPAGDVPTDLAAAVLARLGLDPAAAREALVGAAAGRAVTGRTTRSPAVTDVVARAGAAADARGATAADTGDLLEVLALDAGDLAGATPATVADEVARLRRYGFADA